ncbi:MAG: PilZ domain-containing protein [Pirellulales bacterium]
MKPEVPGKSLANLIAWLSVCVLSAAWGAGMDASWQNCWKQLGAFGLASAVGLNAAARVRATYKRRAHQIAVASHLEERLTNFADEPELDPQLRSAVARLLDEVEADSTTANDDRTRFPVSSGWPVLATPLTQTGGPSRRATTTRAVLRNVSRTGIGLLHSIPLPIGTMRLTYRLNDGHIVSLIIEIRWCERQSDGRFASGGRFLEVATPDARELAVHGKGLIAGDSPLETGCHDDCSMTVAQ